MFDGTPPKSDARPAQEPATAPNVRGGLFGGISIGGGRIQDSYTGIGAVALDVNAGLYLTPSFGVAVEGSLMGRTIDEQHSVTFMGGALLAEYRIFNPLWVSAGPGYYALTMSTKDPNGELDEEGKPVEKGDAIPGPGAQAAIGLELYQPADSGFGCGLVVRSQFAAVDDGPLYSTLGLVGFRWYAKRGAEQRATREAGDLTSPSGFAIDSDCPESVRSTLSGFAFSGAPCLHRLAQSPPGIDFVLGFTAKLLRKTSFGVWLSDALGLAQNFGVGVEYDSEAGAVRMRVKPKGGLERTFLRNVAPNQRNRAFQIAHTASRVNVWLDRELLFSQPAEVSAKNIAFKTTGDAVELQNLRLESLPSETAAAYSTAPVFPPLPVPEPAAEPAPPPEPSPEASPPVAETPSQQVARLVRAYYADLNSGDFEAARYFSPSVTRYISQRNTTPAAIDDYVLKVFPKQYRDHQFAMDESTLAETSEPGVFTFTERVSYYNVSLKQHENLTTLVRARVGADGKLIELWQSKVLTR